MHRFLSSRGALAAALIVAGTALLTPASLKAVVVEHWDFEDGADGTPFTNTDGNTLGNEGTGGSTGVNGTLMRGWDEYWGPDWSSAAASPEGGLLGMTVKDGHEDGYTIDGALHNWTSSDWTLEVHVKFDSFDGWETIVGRDGSSFSVAESDFYFQRKGMDNNELRLNYRTSGGTQYVVDGVTTLQEGHWYGLAAVADSTAGTITLLIDDGNGYVQDGQLTGLAEDLGVYSSAINWTFGRGWYNGGFGDRLDGYLDNVRISDTALAPSELLPVGVVPEPSTVVLAGLAIAIAARAMTTRRR